MKNTIIFLITLLLLLPACKKSRWNPKCWKGKEKAVIINLLGIPVNCGPQFVLESTGVAYDITNEIPERFIPELGDSVHVKLTYHLVELNGSQPWCTSNYAEIDCIQNR